MIKISRRGFRFLAILLVAVFSLSLVAVPGARAESPDLSCLADKAASYLYHEFIKNGAKNGDAYVGSYATWVLRQAGVDVSAWVYNGTSLKDAVIALINQDLNNQQASAKFLAQDLLAAQALGQEELVNQLLQALKNREQETGFDNNLFSDLPAYDLLGRAGYLSSESVFNTVYARDYILGAQNRESIDESVYGCWGWTWEGNFYPDFMTTAQAVRALSYLDPEKKDADVQAAIGLGLNWLEKQQQSDGSFAVGWDDPLLDTVEMAATLKVLGMPLGEGPVDYLIDRALNDDGSFGTTKNAGDATWALWGYHILGTNVAPAVAIKPFSAALNIGDTIQFNAVMFDVYAIDHDVTNDAVWSVADDGVASVVYGLVTGLKPGTTVVRAAYGGLTGSASVTVKSTPPSGGGSTYTVEIAVVGMDGELLYGPGSVTVSASNEWGITALGALDATGLPYTMSDRWPDFVDSICGQAGSGMAGWCYVVNGNIPSVAAAKYNVRDGDRIIWYYSKDMNEPPPKWEDLVKQASSGTVSAAAAVQQVADIISGLQSGKLSTAQALAGISDLLDQIKATEVTKELKDRLAETAQTLSQLVANLPDKALSIRTDGKTASVRVDDKAVKDQVSAIKNAAALAEKLDKIGVTGAANLVAEQIVVKLPPELTGQPALTVELPGEAAQEILEGGLGLAVKGVETSLSLPPEALKEVLAAAPNLSMLDIAVEQIDTAKANPFRGAAVIGGKAFDLNLKAVTSEGKSETLKTCFAKKATVMFSLEGVDLSKIDKSRLAVYRQNQDGSWEFVGGSLSRDGKTFSFETDHLSVYALMEFQNPFKDIANHWAREAIEQMTMRLIVRGVGDDTFAPDRPLTRAQFAALLVRALGLEQQTPPEATFQDVAPGYWGYGAIEAAARAELVKGTGDGNFEPDRTVKREEMATVLANILKQNGLDPGLTAAQTAALLQGYNDSGQISDWAKESMAMCLNKGIIGGRPGATIAPGDKATRAEAVVVLQKLLRVLGRF